MLIVCLHPSGTMGSYNPFRLILVSLLCLMIAVVLSTVNSSEDFYELLGIERDATTKDIRRAFKKIALSEHPDKNPVSCTFVCY